MTRYESRLHMHIEDLIASISKDYLASKQQELITNIRKELMSGQWPVGDSSKNEALPPEVSKEPPKAFSDVQWDEVSCQQKAKARGDLTFTLVGQDISSPRTICFWIMENVETCPAPKLKEALDKALKMRDLAERKQAD